MEIDGSVCNHLRIPTHIVVVQSSLLTQDLVPLQHKRLTLANRGYSLKPTLSEGCQYSVEWITKFVLLFRIFMR